MSRKKEREYALKGIFQLDFHTEPADFTDSIAYFLEDNELDMTYGKALIDATEAHLSEIDEILDEYLKETWKIDRIPKVEKSILRLAICELLFMQEKVPFEVVINEAIELTKKYGDEDGKNYVNGILNKIVKDRQDVRL
ncbi:transcription antitermination factor NusB [Acetobacterium fimetarium]|uniref:Transcription antitermination protein NusB n=1 Tax=Acetobacterium fimetarium TaxID=52691 RepID=A0ABR6WY07_9FIRM|nr:transcription antitermination factor NusB [Acetobacterium fimetarium]MBC3805520.1 transcription antitermination factor NusB [Acetobacterium fimetarium]